MFLFPRHDVVKYLFTSVHDWNIVRRIEVNVGALCSERSTILYVPCFDGKRPNFSICGNGSHRQYTIPGGYKANPLAAETIRQAPTTTQIPLLGKRESASTPQSANAWPKWLRRFDRYRVGSGLSIKPETQKSVLFVGVVDDSLSDRLQLSRLNTDRSCSNEPSGRIYSTKP